MLKISPTTEAERARVLRALAAKPARVLQIRCARGCALAKVSATAEGLLFQAEPWKVLPALPVELRHDGERASRRETVRRMLTDDTTGAADDHSETHASLAVLAADAETVDLLTRCAHGDAVLAPDDVITWHSAGRAPKIRTDMGASTYARPEPWGGERSVTRITRRIGSGAVPVDELAHWLSNGSEFPPGA